MIKGVIFDLDGVLVSTDKFHYEAWRQLCLDYGKQLTYEQNDLLRGVGRLDCVEIILKLFGLTMTETEKTAFATAKNTLYLSKLDVLDSSYCTQGALSTIKELKKLGVKVALGSASKNAKFILDKIGLLPYFDVIVDGSQITKSKPDPEIYAKAVSLLSFEPIECLVVEDAESGMISAKRAGCKCVSFNSTSVQYADYSVENLSQLIELIAKE